MRLAEHGRRAVQHRLVACILITAQRLGAQAVLACKKPEDIPPEALLRAGFTEEDLDGTLAALRPGRLRPLQGHRLQGPRRHLPGDADHRRDATASSCGTARAIDIADQAQKEGVRDLRQSGLLKVKQGITSLEEIEAVHQRMTHQPDEVITWPPQPQRSDRDVKEYTSSGKASTATTGRCAARCARRRETVVTTNLRRQGIRVTKVKKQSFRGGGSVSEKDITFFTRQLATMLKAGVPLLQAFDIVARGHSNAALRAPDDGHQGPGRGRLEPVAGVPRVPGASSTRCTATWCSAGETAGMLDAHPRAARDLQGKDPRDQGQDQVGAVLSDLGRSSSRSSSSG